MKFIYLLSIILFLNVVDCAFGLGVPGVIDQLCMRISSKSQCAKLKENKPATKDTNPTNSASSRSPISPFPLRPPIIYSRLLDKMKNHQLSPSNPQTSESDKVTKEERLKELFEKKKPRPSRPKKANIKKRFYKFKFILKT